MRAGLMPALTVILALAAAPLQAETAPGPATGNAGPKFVKPEMTAVDSSSTATEANGTAMVETGNAGAAIDTLPSQTAPTLAEEILSAATLPEEPADAADTTEIVDTPAAPPPAETTEAAAAAEVFTADPATIESPAHSPEVVLAVTTSGVNRALNIVDELKRETIEVRVSISQQMMEVWYNGEMIHEWPVSTARKGKVTPKGSFKPQWLSKNHKSSLYNNAPMPYSIFYSGNYAIHGTDQESKLGRPASAGCVRLSRANAKILFAMVQQEGKSKMKVEILD